MTPAAVAPPWLAALQGLRRRWPGSLLCIVIALAAGFVARLHDGPVLLYALFMGMSFHYLHEDERTRPGVEFCARTLLRVGIALLGARITVAQIAALGWPTVLTVLSGVATTLGFGLLGARALRLRPAQGVLSGGAVAICGASAALAIAAVLPRDADRAREQDRFTLLVVVSVTTLSTVAMLLYPLLVRALDLPPALAGLFLGGSIHDVAQVVGAGYLLGPATGDAATIVKLFRVALLVVVVVGVSASFRRGPGADTGRPPALPTLVPWFLQGFVVLVVLNSLGWISSGVSQQFGDASRACLVVAIAALGAKTSFPSLFRAGWRPLALVLAETLWLAAWVLGAVLLQR